MNAYELADIVDRWAYKESAEYLTDAANMLRQQANRIVELEKELYFKNYYEELPDTPVGIYTTPQKYCPTENNAAYEKGVIDGMAKQRQSRVDGIIGQIGDSPIHDLVHRTTPQIKELSDEEINAVYHEVWNSNKWSDVEGIDIEKFARAILKKASEK